MAYTRAWDEASPAGSEDANTLDTIIQDKMKDIRERMDDIVRDWGDDAEDPKRIKAASDVAASRPAWGDADLGELFFRQDQGQLDIAGLAEWLAVSGSLGWVAYDDAQAVASKVVTQENVSQVFLIEFSGTSDGSGEIEIDFDELDEVDITGLGITFEYMVVAGNTNSNSIVVIQETATSGSSVTLSLTDNAGSSVTNQSVQINFLLFVFAE